ncbi:pyridoxamine 5'-phosphate oxidase family protein [Prolixibacteraceae bacterium JC049]|nr:pyridoxamine 5'-phosphate oxidase family protein [Prolixibacteraceae bacterium JC049]
MRRKEKEITQKEELIEILEKANVCRIGLMDEEYPYVVPVNYGYKDNALYFHSAVEGRKMDLIRKNNKVGFEIDVDTELMKHDISCKWSIRFRSIIGTGTIEILDDLEDKRMGLDVLMNHHGKMENKFPDGVLKKTAVLKLCIKEMSGKKSGL